MKDIIPIFQKAKKFSLADGNVFAADKMLIMFLLALAADKSTMLKIKNDRMICL